MCGVFGVVAFNPGDEVPVRRLEHAIRTGLRLSESRGKDASGLVALTGTGAVVAKAPVRGAQLLRGRAARQVLAEARFAAEQGHPYVVLGHTRMMTTGDHTNPANNQPVVRDSLAALHNGIIVNAEQLWNEIPLAPTAQVDTEAFVALALHLGASGVNRQQALELAFTRIEGANTIATLDATALILHIATSNGSCHLIENSELGLLIFASEPRVVMQMCAGLGLATAAGEARRLLPGASLTVSLSRKGCDDSLPDRTRVLAEPGRAAESRRRPNRPSTVEPLLTIDSESIAALERCRTCVLPVTFPFIDLDEEGRCVLCRTAEPRIVRPIEELVGFLEDARRRGASPEILVPISGGRDSCYALHYLVTELELPVVAYTYDWGFVTDRARRNISRLCGALKVEHVLVAADLRRKRENVRRNLLAWARRPELGMIPLFMAGDKHFFHYAGAIRRERNLCGTVFSMNWLERTDFKAGFAAVDDRSRTGRTYELRPGSRVRLGAYYARQALRTPAYLNRSVTDSIFGFAAYYFRRQDYHQLFDYISWDERTVNRTIIDGYGWETAEDSPSTWRVGDGTAAFYNFAYLSAAGFTEHDAFRSNQIRTGLLDRATALRLVEDENVPQPRAFATYCATAGVNPSTLVDAVRRIPRRY